MQHNTHVNTHSVDTAIPFKISITSPETLNCVNVHLYSAVQLHVGSHTLVALGKHNIFFKEKGGGAGDGGERDEGRGCGGNDGGGEEGRPGGRGLWGKE